MVSLTGTNPLLEAAILLIAQSLLEHGLPCALFLAMIQISNRSDQTALLLVPGETKVCHGDGLVHGTRH